MFDRNRTSWLIPMCVVAFGFGLVTAPVGAEFIADGVTVSPADGPMAEVPRQPYPVGPTIKDETPTIDCSAYENSIGREPSEYREQCGGWAFVPETTTWLDRAPTSTAYALDIGYLSDNFVTFPLNDFPGQTVVGQQDASIYAMDFGPGAFVLWAVDDGLDELGTINLADGSFTGMSACTNPDGNFTGMTIAKDGTMYASSSTNLYVLDPTNPTDCSPVLVGPFGAGGTMIDIAINAEDEMYGHDIADDTIYQIDPATGAATALGLTMYDASWAQGMDFDGEDGTLYIWLYIGGGANVYGTVDLLTGAVLPMAVDSPTGEFEGAIQVPMVEMLVPNGPMIEFDEGLPESWQTFPEGPEAFGSVYWSTTDDPAATDNPYGMDLGTPPGAVADADFLNYPTIEPYEAELWTNSFSLVGTGQPTLNFLWMHRALSDSVFQVDVSADGGGTWTNVMYDDVGNYSDGGAAAALDLTPWIGEPDVTVRFLFSGDSWDWYAQVDEVYLTATYPSLELRKTVGTVPEECAATDFVAVSAGDEVVYCYTATNTGNVPLTLQSLVDDVEGQILNEFPFILLPGYSVQAVIAPVPVYTTTINSGTWTGFNPGPVDIAEATDTATVLVFNNDTCDDAEPLFCPGGGGMSTVYGSTVDATFSDAGTCAGFSHTAPEAWYHIVGNGGEITFTTCNAATDYDTKITVWTGTCGGLVCEDANDDDCDGFSSLRSTVTIPTVVGVDYYVMVHGWSSNTGFFELNVVCEVPVELQSFSIE